MTEEQRNNTKRLALSVAIVYVVVYVVMFVWSDLSLSGPEAMWLIGTVFLGPLVLVGLLSLVCYIGKQLGGGGGDDSDLMQ